MQLKHIISTAKLNKKNNNSHKPGSVFALHVTMTLTKA